MTCQSVRTRSPTRAWSRDDRGSITPSLENTNRTKPAASNPDDGDVPPRRYGVPMKLLAVDNNRSAVPLADATRRRQSFQGDVAVAGEDDRNGATGHASAADVERGADRRTSPSVGGASWEFGITYRLIRQRHSPKRPSALPSGSVIPPP